jgi:hypothetical protein
MQTKKVNQYKCDFCGKKGYSAGHMKKHELHCTKNINRICKFCEVNESKNNLQELIAMLPDPIYNEYNWESNTMCLEKNDINYFDLKNEEEIKEALLKLKDKANHCPACILAALRIKKINCYTVDFNYKKEKEEFWEDRKPDISECCY